jgi:hypothetical protein
MIGHAGTAPRYNAADIEGTPEQPFLEAARKGEKWS